MVELERLIMNPKIIIFDFDGVIADTFTVAHAVKQMEYPGMSEEQYRAKFNGNIGVADFSDFHRVPLDFQFEYAKKMDGLLLEPKYKDAVLAICSIAPAYIVSSTNTDTIKVFNRSNGIDGCFRDVLGFDVFASKVKKFKMIFEKEHVSATEVLFITDTVGDINEAHEVGITNIIAVTSGYQSEEIIRAANPGCMVHSIVEAASLLLITD